MSRSQTQRLVLAIGVSVGVVATSALLMVALAAAGRGPERHSDFAVYYTSAALLRSGESPYDPQAELDMRAHLIGAPADPDAVMYYFYPPPFLLLILPLTLLSATSASFVWTSLQVFGVWPGCAYLLGKHLPLRPWLLVLAWSLPWLPTVVTLRFGQVSLLLLLALLGIIEALSRKRDWLAGLCLAGLLLKPVLLVAPVALLVYLRRWKALLTGCAAVALPTLLMVAIFGPGVLYGYLEMLRIAAHFQASNAWWRSSTYSLAALTRRLGGFYGLALILLDLDALGTWLQIGGRRGRFDAAATAPLFGLLVSPHVLIYDLVVCLAVVPSIMRRPLYVSAPLLVAGFVLAWVGHLVLLEPSVVVLWLLSLLGVVAVVPPYQPASPPGVRAAF